MSSCNIFVAHGMRRENVFMQPWRYIYELAVYFSNRKPVVIITDTNNINHIEEWSTKLKIIYTNKLSPFHCFELHKMIIGYRPENIWWSTTPRSLLYRQIIRRFNCPVTAIVTCPLYSWRLLMRALVTGVPWREIRTLIAQRMVPRFLFSKMLSDKVITRVVTLSQTNCDLLVEAGVPKRKIRVIPTGLDSADRISINSSQIAISREMLGFPEHANIFLYMGALRRIRGVYALLDAIPLVNRRNQHAYFGILARGADEKQCEMVRAYCDCLGVSDRVKVVGGWLTREQVLASIEASDVVMLPFIIVPSDVPIAILEALARGKPVISSNVDGIPELIHGRGKVVNPLDKNSMAEAMLEFLESETYRKEMGEAARSFMAEYPDWDRIGEMHEQWVTEND